MQILLHATGWRVDYRKHRGLFSKNVGADRYAGDLTRLGNADGRRISIKRPWMRVGEGRRLWSPERSSAAARGKEIAGVCHIGGPGVSLTRFWVRSDQRRMRDPPGSRSGHGGARSCARDGGGDSGRRDSPAGMCVLRQCRKRLQKGFAEHA